MEPSTATDDTTSSGWANRIVDFQPEVPADQLTAHPLNARRHPGRQRDALRESLGRVGWVDVVKVNTRTGNVVDGHARIEEALTKGSTVPVLYIDVDPDEERFVLATLDPISAMAEYDTEVLDQLIDGLTFESDGLADFIGELAAGGPDYDGLGGGDGGSGGGGDDPGTGPSLTDRFLVPPFSVLDARQGYWTERKRQWLALGIRSEEGRPENLLEMSEQVLNGYGGSKAPRNPNRSRPNSLHASDPHFYFKKTAAEKELGRELTSEEFIELYRDRIDPVAGTSVFDPVLCELAYRWWCPPQGRVLDPFAGGSVRGIVASRLGLPYTGIELRGEQIEANRTQATEIVRPDDPTPEWIEGDSAEVLPALDADPFDFVFSCPPYGDLEVYSDNPADLSTLEWPEFLDAYRRIIAAAVDRLADDRFACFVVGDIRDTRTGAYRGFVPETIRAFEDAGAAFYNDAVLVTPAGSLALRAPRIFAGGRKLGKAHQNVLVFVKGDWRKATEHLGELELPDPAEFFAAAGEEEGE